MGSVRDLFALVEAEPPLTTRQLADRVIRRALLPTSRRRVEYADDMQAEPRQEARAVGHRHDEHPDEPREHLRLVDLPQAGVKEAEYGRDARVPVLRLPRSLPAEFLVQVLAAVATLQGVPLNHLLAVRARPRLGRPFRRLF